MEENGKTNQAFEMLDHIDNAEPNNAKVDDSSMSDQHNNYDLSYGVNDNPSIITTILLGLQHYLAAISGLFIIPLIISKGMCMAETDVGLEGRGLVISTGMFVAGIATFLQTTFGVRLPTVQGPAGVFISPALIVLNLPRNICPPPMDLALTNGTLLYNDTDGSIVDGKELWQRRAREIQGAIIVASLVQLTLGLTGLAGLLVKIISPLTISASIGLVAFSLLQSTINFAQKQWGIALLTYAVIVISSKYLANVKVPYPSCTKNGMQKKTVDLFRRTAVVNGVIVGWILSLILTETGVYTEDKTDMQYLARTDARVNALRKATWIRWPYPGQWGTPVITAAGIAAMIAATLGSILESLGDYHITAKVSGAPPPPAHAINRGVAIEGFACLLNGVMGSTSGLTSYSQNSAVIEMTRVGSRRVVQAAAVLMFLFGLITKFSAFIVMIPDPVLGGVALAVYSSLFSVAVSNLSYVDLRISRNYFIFGTALFIGYLSPTYISANIGVIDTKVVTLDQIFTALLGNNVLVGGLTAMFLDLTLPGDFKNIRTVFCSHEVVEGKDDEKKVYDLPLIKNACCKFEKYFPFMPAYG